MIRRRRQRNTEYHNAHKNDPAYKAQREINRSRFYEANKDRTREQRNADTAAWRIRNAEAVRLYDQAYRRRNRDQVRAKNQRRRALILDAWDEDVDLGQLFVRDAGTCGICHQPVDPQLAWPDKMSKSLDHIVPLSKGGRHSWANAQLAHAVCNSRKNNFV
jgi:5-methylcytosine-specific restriction endonuclease McrA